MPTRRALLSARTPQTDQGLRGEEPGRHCFLRGSEDGLAQAAGCPRGAHGGLSAQGWHLLLGAGVTRPTQICGFLCQEPCAQLGASESWAIPSKGEIYWGLPLPVKQRPQARKEGNSAQNEANPQATCRLTRHLCGRCPHSIRGCWG